MALNIAREQTDQRQVELIGVRTDKSHEVETMRAVLAAKDAHIDSLESQAWAWRSQASNERRAYRLLQKESWARECELISVIHQQTLLLQNVQRNATEAARRRHWWNRKSSYKGKP